MSYDLAIWRGQSPIDSTAAFREYIERSEQAEELLSEGSVVKADPDLVSFTLAIMAMWPEVDESARLAVSPLTDEIFGTFMVIPMTSETTDQDVDAVVAAACDNGLVCFDPQTGELLS